MRNLTLTLRRCCGSADVNIESGFRQIGHGDSMAFCQAWCRSCGKVVSHSGYPGEPLAAQVVADWNKPPAIHMPTVDACIARLEQGGQSAAVSILRHHFEQKGSAL